MKAAFVNMSLELNVECPNADCTEYFNLFDIQELTDDGFLYTLVVPKDGPWGCRDFQKQLDDAGIEIHCPKCGTKVEIESVEW
jgi:hypothetical protein